MHGGWRSTIEHGLIDAHDRKLARCGIPSALHRCQCPMPSRFYQSTFGSRRADNVILGALPSRGLLRVALGGANLG